MQLDIKSANGTNPRATSECDEESIAGPERVARGRAGPAADRPPGLASALNEHLAGRVRKAQLGALLKLTPAMMLANIANGAMVAFAFWQEEYRSFLATWFLALGLTIMLGLRAWLRSQSRPAPETVSPRGLRSAVWHALTLGAVWAVIPLVLFGGASEPQRVMLAALITGMIAGGAFALSTVPAAALAYSMSIALASMVALLISGEPIYLMVAGLLVTFVLIVAGSICWNGRLFVERLTKEVDLERQSELIGLLLRDFEESASDWLWETDGEGRLQHISPRFAEVTGRSREALQGRRLFDLLRPVDRRDAGRRRNDDDQDLLNGLRHSMEQRAAFRDRTVHVQVGRDRRFWSLSAKPVHDAKGNFKGYRGVGTDVTDKIRAERKLAYLAHVDPLTDLANRSSLEIHLAAAFRALRANGESFSLICLDLDGFKAVNDAYGHAAGDRLLALVGKRLRRCVREGDVVARIGGDEFAILQRADEQPKASLALAERVVSTLSSPFEIQGRRVTLGASVGVAQGGRDGSNPMSLLRHADIALYRAKRCGRGRFLLYQPRMETDAKMAAFSLSKSLVRQQRRLRAREPETADQLG